MFSLIYYWKLLKSILKFFCMKNVPIWCRKLMGHSFNSQKKNLCVHAHISNIYSNAWQLSIGSVYFCRIWFLLDEGAAAIAIHSWTWRFCLHFSRTNCDATHSKTHCFEYLCIYFANEKKFPSVKSFQIQN